MKTFHNMGYIAVGDVAAKLNVKFKKKECESWVAEGNLGGEKVIIARPVTYMNLSGRAVKQLLSPFASAIAASAARSHAETNKCSCLQSIRLLRLTSWLYTMITIYRKAR